MKLRNIYLLVLAVSVLSGCSKDDSSAPDVPAAPMDALVSFAASGSQTRATTTSLEEKVTELTAFIFKADGTLAGSEQIASENNITKIEHIKIKVSSKSGALSEDSFTAVLVANANEQVKNISSLTALKDMRLTTLDLTNYNPAAENKKALPMISKEIKFSGVKPLVKGGDIDNWVSADKNGNDVKVAQGATEGVIYLDRLVARVDLVSLKIDLSKYPGASFDLKKVFMANVRSTSPFLNAGNEADFWKGFQSPNFEKKQEWVIVGKDINGTPVEKGVLEKGQNVKPELSKELNVLYSDLQKGYSLENPGLFYVYKNPASTTPIQQSRLILEGIFKRTNADTGELRHFHVVLKDSKSENIEVLSNTVYELTVNITGEGSPNEDDILITAEVGVTIKVSPWKVIDQVEPI